MGDYYNLRKFKDRHLGERVVLVCNGPSLNNMDLSFLSKEITIGLNKIYLGFEKFIFYPRYYVAVNRRVISQSKLEIKKINCVKFIGSAGHDVIEEDGLTYFVNTLDVKDRFSVDLSVGVHEGWTVTHVALQIAFYLGFATVIIIGMDHDFTHRGEANAAELMRGPDTNHFISSYFSPGEFWDCPDLVESERSYRVARRHFEDQGRRIIDATLDGRCKVFDKASYSDIFFRDN